MPSNASPVPLISSVIKRTDEGSHRHKLHNKILKPISSLECGSSPRSCTQLYSCPEHFPFKSLNSPTVQHTGPEIPFCMEAMNPGVA